MKKQYKNQELYDKTILLDKLSTKINPCSPSKKEGNSVECKLRCSNTQINFYIDESENSLSFKQLSTKDNCNNKKSPNYK